jgi:hypothetical protein
METEEKPMALPTIEQVLASPCTHNWLKDALRSALDKDPVDASYDAELLAKLLRARLDSILGMHRDGAGDLIPDAAVFFPDDPGPAAAFSRNAYSRRVHRSA